MRVVAVVGCCEQLPPAGRGSYHIPAHLFCQSCDFVHIIPTNATSSLVGSSYSCTCVRQRTPRIACILRFVKRWIDRLVLSLRAPNSAARSIAACFGVRSCVSLVGSPTYTAVPPRRHRVLPHSTVVPTLADAPSFLIPLLPSCSHNLFFGWPEMARPNFPLSSPPCAAAPAAA